MTQQSAKRTAVRAILKSLGAVLNRIFDDAEGAHWGDLDWEIRRLIDQSGGYFSDETERRIERHLMRNSSFLAECDHGTR